MSSWLQRLRGGTGAEVTQRRTTDPPVQKRTGSISAPPRDQNVPKKRFQIHQKCLYERILPGNAFISAHVNRLQHGFYDSSVLHEPDIDNVYFVSVHFVFHPHDPRSHRFKSAEIEVSVHGDGDHPAAYDNPRYQPPASHPRILKHAPELMFGAVSPENLQWNFSLSSSLGVSQAPVSATVNPTGGVKGSYKVFHMMSIQGSVRSKRSPFGSEYDVEDAMAVWTLEENMLQRSGLPREFDFVLLVEKPDDVKNVYLTVNVDAEVEAWYGAYPKWYTNLARYMPTQDFHLDFNTDIGQRFLPSLPGRGFNFASLPHPLDEYVTMPGTVYPTNDTKGEDERSGGRKQPDYRRFDAEKAIEASPTSPQAQQPATPRRNSRTSRQDQSQQSRHSWASPENLNVRVVLEHQYPRGFDRRRLSYSPLSTQEPTRYPSVRRRKSRSGLKEYGAKQALHELAQNELEGAEPRSNGDRLNGQM
ncbi:Nn.00g074110.m01.CDS01 [Neocucurbitaria sp. VM-36]